MSPFGLKVWQGQWTLISRPRFVSEGKQEKKFVRSWHFPPEEKSFILNELVPFWQDMWYRENSRCPTHVGTLATPSLSLWHQRRPTQAFPWSGRSCPQCSAVWLWGRLSGGSAGKDENVTQLHKLSFFFLHAYTHWHTEPELSVWARLSRMPWAKRLLFMEKVTPCVDIPILQVNACVLPSCQWEPGCPSHQQFKLLSLAGLPDAVSHSSESRLPGISAGIHVLTVLSCRDPKCTKQTTEEKWNLPVTVCFRHSCVHQHCSEQRCLSVVRNVCVWVVGMSTQPHSCAMDNQVPEHCQHLICLPVGKRGPEDCQRQPSANQLQSEECGGEWAAPFTPPSGWPCLYLLLGPWKQSEGLTVCIQRWPEPCLRGGMQSGDACLPGRKCWNLIITPSLSREINEETKKKKKILPCHPTHRHLTDASFNALHKRMLISTQMQVQIHKPSNESIMPHLI